LLLLLLLWRLILLLLLHLLHLLLALLFRLLPLLFLPLTALLLHLLLVLLRLRARGLLQLLLPLLLLRLRVLRLHLRAGLRQWCRSLRLRFLTGSSGPRPLVLFGRASCLACRTRGNRLSGSARLRPCGLFALLLLLLSGSRRSNNARLSGRLFLSRTSGSAWPCPLSLLGRRCRLTGSDALRSFLLAANATARCRTGELDGGRFLRRPGPFL
jgi:hypothetical protein